MSSAVTDLRQGSSGKYSGSDVGLMCVMTNLHALLPFRWTWPVQRRQMREVERQVSPSLWHISLHLLYLFATYAAWSALHTACYLQCFSSLSPPSVPKLWHNPWSMSEMIYCCGWMNDISSRGSIVGEGTIHHVCKHVSHLERTYSETKCSAVEAHMYFCLEISSDP